MGLSPAQILAASNGGSGDSGFNASGILSAGREAARRRRAALEQAFVDEQEAKNPENSDSVFSSLKSGVGDAIATAGSALDYGRAATTAILAEGGDVLGLSDIQNTDRVQQTGVSLSDIQRNIALRSGTGDYIEASEAGRDLPLNVKRALGLVGDIALDPTTYLTLGASSTAKTGMSRLGRSIGGEGAEVMTRRGLTMLGGGDEVARVLARDGIDQADEVLARVAGENRAALAADQAAKPGATLFSDDLAEAAALQQTPTVRSILGEGALSDDAVDKMLRSIERTGRGGVRFMGKTIVDSDQLSPLWAQGAKAMQAIDRTEPGNTGLGALRSIRRGWRRTTKPNELTREKFGDLADELPNIGRTMEQQVDIATAELDRKLIPTYKSLGADERDVIATALARGGTVEDATRILSEPGLEKQLATFKTIIAARDEAYDGLVSAGYKDLPPKEDYIRHTLTEDGGKAMGIDPRTWNRGPKNPAMPKGNVLEANQELGITAFMDDPVRMARASFGLAMEAKGKKYAWDELDRIARETGAEVTSTTAKPGFTQIVPGHYVDGTLAKDFFNIRKAGADNTLMQHYDALSSTIKRYTLFNPIAFGAYVTQNLGTGIGMNFVRGVKNPIEYVDNGRIQAAVRAGRDAGTDNFDATLAKHGLSPEETILAKHQWEKGLVAAKPIIHDDLERVVKAGKDIPLEPSKWANPGTNWTTKANQHAEEMMRGTLFNRLMKDGLSADEAAKKVLDTHLDYSKYGRTAFERDKINRFVFFPTWLFRAPGAIVRAYAHKPGVAAAQMKVEQGTHWYKRDRNMYGENIGPRLSGPMSFLTGLGSETETDLGGMANPLVAAALSEDARHITDIVPPLAKVMGSPGTASIRERLGSDADYYDDDQNRYWMSQIGVRQGVDFEVERAEKKMGENIAERQAAGLAPTPTQVLTQKAVALGVPRAAARPVRELVVDLVRNYGYTSADIQAILGEPLERNPTKERNDIDVAALLDSGASANDIHKALMG